MEVPVINLTTDSYTLFMYACSHMVIMYDYNSKTISPLQSHVGIRFMILQQTPTSVPLFVDIEVFALLFSKVP